jgi:hypothetical protein
MANVNLPRQVGRRAPGFLRGPDVEPHQITAVSAVNAVFIDTSSQLGECESGILAAWVGAVHAAVLGGLGTLIVDGLWMLMFPNLRRRQHLEGN